MSKMNGHTSPLAPVGIGRAPFIARNAIAPGGYLQAFHFGGRHAVMCMDKAMACRHISRDAIAELALVMPDGILLVAEPVR